MLSACACILTTILGMWFCPTARAESEKAASATEWSNACLRINLPAKRRLRSPRTAPTKRAAAVGRRSLEKPGQAGDRLVGDRRRWTSWLHEGVDGSARQARRRCGFRLWAPSLWAPARERRAPATAFRFFAEALLCALLRRGSLTTSWQPLGDFFAPFASFLAAFFADFFRGLLRRLLGGLLLRHDGLLGFLSPLGLPPLSLLLPSGPPVDAVHVCRALRIVRRARPGRHFP